MGQSGPTVPVVVTPDDFAAAQARIKDSAKGAVPLSLALFVIVQLLVGLVVVREAGQIHGMALIGLTTVATFAVLAPIVIAIAAFGMGRSIRQLAESLARQREMVEEARRRDFETRLANALEMAGSELRVMAVAERALVGVLDDGRGEILLADNSYAHLKRAVVAGPADGGCSVESPDQCVAARRGQTQVFADSGALDACPHLQDRSVGRCGAVCVPVSVMGRTVGLVHRVEPHPAVLSPSSTAQLEMLANQLGARLGMLRMMTESQLQASTDGLTGLANRRAFENEVHRLRDSRLDYCIVMADLDDFKRLNDTFGHEAGDRALRIFASVLRTNLRPNDVACRHGGEEFAVALPGCLTPEALATCERLRDALAIVTGAGGSPAFTASFGIAQALDGEPLERVIGNADRALYYAKRNGRNRVIVYSDHMDDELARLVDESREDRSSLQ